MTTPYTVTTPEYVAWAKKGERDGESNEPFTNMAQELCDMAESDELDWKTYEKGREQLRIAFSFDVDCDCSE